MFIEEIMLITTRLETRYFSIVLYCIDGMFGWFGFPAYLLSALLIPRRYGINRRNICVPWLACSWSTMKSICADHKRLFDGSHARACVRRISSPHCTEPSPFYTKKKKKWALTRQALQLSRTDGGPC